MPIAVVPRHVRESNIRLAQQVTDIMGLVGRQAAKLGQDSGIRKELPSKIISHPLDLRTQKVLPGFHPNEVTLIRFAIQAEASEEPKDELREFIILKCPLVYENGSGHVHGMEVDMLDQPSPLQAVNLAGSTRLGVENPWEE